MIPTVIGIYGVSGSGKTTLLSEIQKMRPEWRCIDGSEVIKNVMINEGKLSHDFSTMDESSKKAVRTRAIEMVKRYQGVTIVAGHCSFPVSKACPNNCKYYDFFTEGDGKTYDAIYYLDTSPSIIYQQRKNDTDNAKRVRRNISVNSIEDWSNHEKAYLQEVCAKYGIHFAHCHEKNDVINNVIENFVIPNVSEAKQKSNDALYAAIKSIPDADIFLLIDGDRTLCREDSGAIFIGHCSSLDSDPLKQIFQRYSTYTFQSFLEVAMFYERIMHFEDYNKISKEIGQRHIKIYPQWVHMLSKLPENVHPVLVSSGNREIWQTALNLKDIKISIIAGNHIGLHSYIVDNDAKSIVASELRARWAGCKILSFGDSGTYIKDDIIA